MFWVAVFIIGLFGTLAGIIPVILNGLRFRNVALLIIGIAMLGAGSVGVIAKPNFIALKMPRIVFGESDAPVAAAPGIEAPAASPEVASAPSPAVNAPAAAATADKDESQLPAAKLPQPVSVTTTTVVGNEVDPLANPAAPAPENVPVLPPPVATAAVAPPPSPEAVAAEQLAALTSQQPKDEAAFTKILVDSRAEYDKADDAGRDTAQSSRATAICRALPKPDVKGWVGMVKEVDRDAGGRIILTVALPDGTLVKTWNNAMSDTEDKTLIVAGTPLAAVVGPLQPGDTVRFGGTFFSDEPDCYRSSRLSLDQSMTDPSFLFRFTAVDKI
ncbi:hypothetical protein OSH11_06050 [Kaistia dalseonensis]|uniref:Uncharacterized protein n=1 Tax=Kaistia dalseonensis TaxID=410840 RepID=A0ABU0H3F4_9HYPH|nr:hypothetical protein [Kaistia dalseonensis]MCX5494253.1 hypothetical protein [Kaistia dalseonensis]MDQ0436833.1 hypothetical protein [Kaistia dalseonensis]